MHVDSAIESNFLHVPRPLDLVDAYLVERVVIDHQWLVVLRTIVRWTGEILVILRLDSQGTIVVALDADGVEGVAAERGLEIIRDAADEARLAPAVLSAI